MVSSSDERKNVQGIDERYGVMQETFSPIHLLTFVSLFFSVWWSPGGEFGLPSHPLTAWHECGIALNAREVSRVPSMIVGAYPEQLLAAASGRASAYLESCPQNGAGSARGPTICGAQIDPSTVH